VTGRIDSSNPINNGVTLTHVGSFDNFILKMNASTGVAVWGRVFGNALSTGGFSTLALDSSGNIYYADNFLGDISYDSNSFINPDGSSSTLSEAALVKISKVDGSVIWAKHLSGANPQTILQPYIEQDGSITLVGSHTGDFSFNNSTIGGSGSDPSGFIMRWPSTSF